eukprot:476667_1
MVLEFKLKQWIFDMENAQQQQQQQQQQEAHATDTTPATHLISPHNTPHITSRPSGNLIRLWMRINPFTTTTRGNNNMNITTQIRIMNGHNSISKYESTTH